MEPLVDRVTRVLPECTGAERKVARRLVADGATAGLGSSTALAARSGVSGPTVTRFVKKLGFGNFQEFQAAVHAEIDARFVSPVELLRADSQERPRQPWQGLETAIATTFAGMASIEMESACALLANPKFTVVTAGGWSTHLLARHLAAQLQQIRPGAHYAGEAPSDLMAWAQAPGPPLAVVLFDVRRYESHTLALARHLRAHGARIVLVTDPWFSPVANEAEIVIPVSVDTGHSFDSLVPALAVVEAMVDQIASQLGESAVTHFQSYDTYSMEVAPRWRPDTDS